MPSARRKRINELRFRVGRRLDIAKLTAPADFVSWQTLFMALLTALDWRKL